MKMNPAQAMADATRALILGLLTAALDRARDFVCIREIRRMMPPRSFDVELGSRMVLRISVEVLAMPETGVHVVGMPETGQAEGAEQPVEDD